MTDASPENDDWLRALIDRSAVLPDAAIKRHWRTLLPWLPTQARYELAAILLDVEPGVRPKSQNLTPVNGRTPINDWLEGRQSTWL